MALNDVEFSDMFLLPTGTAVMKGMPGYDSRLYPVTPEYTEELDSIRKLLQAAQYQNKMVFRFKYLGRAYRVARYHDIDQGETFFLRRLPEFVPNIRNLGLIDDLVDWLLSEKQQHGLIIFTGDQSAGKTTTAAAFIMERLRLFGGHATSFEIPVEMPLAGQQGEHGWCFQEEIESEEVLGAHIERSHRYGSPNYIYVGEIRGKFAASETLRVALGSSEQIVVTTMHGHDIITALDRLIGFAKVIDGDMAALNLSHSILAIIHLDLKSIDGRKVLLTPEYLLFPFTEKSKGMRAKIREMRWSALAADITQQGNIGNNRGLKDL